MQTDGPFPLRASVTDGAIHNVFVVECCHAGCTNQLKIIRPPHIREFKASAVINRVIEKGFEEAGWTSKRHFRRPTCPEHQKHTPAAKEKPVAMTAEVAQREMNASKQVEPARQPSLQQRRTILEQLEMVYNVDKGCYSKGHSDASLAKAGNYPRKWVMDIREQFFGLNEKSEDFEETLKAIDTINDKLSTCEARIFSELEKVQELQKQLKQLADNLAK